MKYIFLILVFFSLIGNSQTSGRVEYLVSTHFAFQYNTLAILEFENGNSKYVVLSSDEVTKEMTSTIEDMHLTIYMPESKSRPANYTNLTDSLLINEVPLMKSLYTVKENLPKIDWQIKNEFKTLSEIQCQKATGYFRGRTYTAWFANDIPLPFGPWKLQGLPGIILEATDDQNQVSFKATRISFENVEPIIFPDKDKAIELKEFVTTTIPNIYKEIEAIANSKSPSRDTTIKLSLPNRQTTKEIIYEWEETTDVED